MNKKTKLSKPELKYFEGLIQNKKKKVSEELEAIKGILSDQREYVSRTDIDFGSDASQIRNREMLKSMRKRLKSRVTKYEDALMRISKGRYGICRKTGKQISKQRLMVMPEAETCIRGKF